MPGAATIAALAASLGALGAADVLALVRDRRRAWALSRPSRGRERAHGRVVSRLGRGFGAKAPASLPARIAAAGLDAAPAEVMARKAGGAIAALGAATLLAPAAPGRLALPLLAGLPTAAFFIPDARLRARTRDRACRMEAELADVLDLLRVAAGAGLTPRRALAEVGRRHPGPLAAELGRAAARARFGVPIANALENLERRSPAAGVAELVAALNRADRHGAPLAETLAAQAARARTRAAQRTLERAARAAPQIQLVVALLLVPAVLLLVAAALLPALAGGRI
jgi:tight adherence protein C